MLNFASARRLSLGLLVSGFMASAAFVPAMAASTAEASPTVADTPKAAETQSTEQSANQESTVAPEQTQVDDESGPKITTQQHGDWLLECYDPAINGVNCQIKQRIIQQESEQNILVISLAYEPKEKTNVIQYILPLDFLLTPGVSIEAGKYQTVAGVTRCTVQGCFIEGTTDQAFIDQMRETTTGGRAVIVSRTGQKIGIGFSAKGFTKAYSQMVEENKRLADANNG